MNNQLYTEITEVKWPFCLGWKTACENAVCVIMLDLSTKVRSISVQTQLNSICYIKLHVSTYFRSSSDSQLVLKTY
jgi:hypothetical protein